MALNLVFRSLNVEDNILIVLPLVVSSNSWGWKVVESWRIVLLGFIFNLILRRILSLLASFVYENVWRALENWKMWISSPCFILDISYFAFIGSLLWTQFGVWNFKLAESACLAKECIYLFYVQSFFSRYRAGTNIAFIVVKWFVHNARLLLLEGDRAVKGFSKLSLSLLGPVAIIGKVSRHYPLSNWLV